MNTVVDCEYKLFCLYLSPVEAGNKKSHRCGGFVLFFIVLSRADSYVSPEARVENSWCLTQSQIHFSCVDGSYYMTGTKTSQKSAAD